MPRRQHAVAAVEIAHLTGVQVRCPHRQPRRAFREPREVDQLTEGLLQWLGRIIAGGIRRERHVQAEEGEGLGLKKPAMPLVRVLQFGRVRPNQGTPATTSNKGGMGDPVPELLEPRQPLGRLVSGDQAGIDGPDGGADDPVRLDAGLVQRLIDAGLIGAQRTAALQHEHHLPSVRPALAAARRSKDVRDSRGCAVEALSLAFMSRSCALGLVSGPAAIGGQRGSGDRGGTFAGKEHRDRAHLLDRGEPLVRLLRQQHLAHHALARQIVGRRLALDLRLDQRRVDVARADRVAGDAIFGGLERGDLGQPDNGVLGRDVG